ncbi:hypothetical protein [Burkholderia guangdongensis]|uniref:hypothetical protein n=1 Tax=Burkholderia guangdongensis TaxID=1792500 RepID=UPI0015CE3A1A|nr:hypothetical protein [Burkholderia guangdongensis]
MASAHQQNAAAPRRTKSSWGPAKNTALSFIAFAVIFGIFAHPKRDVRDERVNIAYDIPHVIEKIISMTDSQDAASAVKPTADATTTTTQAAPPPEASAASPLKPEVEPTIAPRVIADASPTHINPSHASPAIVSRHTRPSHASSVAVANNAHTRPAGSVSKREYGDAHRHPRTQYLASARTRMHAASRPQPYGGDTWHMQTTSVTHQDLEGARALAKARWCAQVDQWRCVEQNASRALAIDPENGESRALLGQAIRNRL